ncbi:hypothetical protein [Nonomuraea angiospora]
MINPKPGEELPEPLADLQAQYRDDWSIWTSQGDDAGFVSRCYATRLARLTDDQIGNGLAETLEAQTPDKLSTLLALQVERAQDLAERRGHA